MRPFADEETELTRGNVELAATGQESALGAAAGILTLLLDPFPSGSGRRAVSVAQTPGSVSATRQEVSPPLTLAPREVRGTALAREGAGTGRSPRPHAAPRVCVPAGAHSFLSSSIRSHRFQSRHHQRRKQQAGSPPCDGRVLVGANRTRQPTKASGTVTECGSWGPSLNGVPERAAQEVTLTRDPKHNVPSKRQGGTRVPSDGEGSNQGTA